MIIKGVDVAVCHCCGKGFVIGNPDENYDKNKIPINDGYEVIITDMKTKKGMVRHLCFTCCEDEIYFDDLLDERF